MRHCDDAACRPGRIACGTQRPHLIQIVDEIQLSEAYRPLSGDLAAAGYRSRVPASGTGILRGATGGSPRPSRWIGAGSR